MTATRSASAHTSLREKVDKDCRLYVTWFGAGLRIIDIHDPADPKELGYFIRNPPTT